MSGVTLAEGVIQGARMSGLGKETLRGLGCRQKPGVGR